MYRKEELLVEGFEELSQNLFEDEGVFMFREYDSYDEFIKEAKVVVNQDYLYALELEKNCVKVGFTSNIERRLKIHTSSKQSDFKGKIKRIGILGPIWNGLFVEQMIHKLCAPYFKNDIYRSIETYFFHKDFNSFDTFMIRWQFFQAMLINDEIELFPRMQLVIPRIENYKS